MILSFSVQNFKSIKDKATLSFEATADTTDESAHIVKIGNTRVLKLAAIYGANASGKTNLLQALDFLQDYVANSIASLRPNEETGFIPFLFNAETRNSPGEFEIAFFIDNIKYEYALRLDYFSIQNERLFYSPKGQRKKIFERIFNEENNNYQYNWGVDFKISGNLVEKARKNIPLLSTIVQLIDDKEIKKVYDWFDITLRTVITSYPQGLRQYTINMLEDQPDYMGEIVSMLNSADIGNIIKINIKNIEIPNEVLESLPEEAKERFKDKSGKYQMKRVFVEHKYGKNNGQIPIEDESLGTMRFFELAGPLGLSSSFPVTLSIDEIESSLHPELQEHLIALFLQNSQRESQLIFTTHNAELMDSNLLRRDEIWFANKNNATGGSEYYSLADIKGVRKAGSFRKQYLSGKFGAVPVITNIPREN